MLFLRTFLTHREMTQLFQHAVTGGIEGDVNAFCQLGPRRGHTWLSLVGDNVKNIVYHDKEIIEGEMTLASNCLHVVNQLTLSSRGEEAKLGVNRWDGVKGGVLLLQVEGDLVIQLGAAISVNGAGYRGGAPYSKGGQPTQGESWNGKGMTANEGGGGGGRKMGSIFYWRCRRRIWYSRT